MISLIIGVDPQNEIAAYKDAIKAGFTTTSQVVAQSGNDIENVLKERKQEQELAKSLGVSLDTSTPETHEEPKLEKGLTAIPRDLEIIRGLTLVEFIPDTENRGKICKKGIPCGSSCISSKKICRKQITVSIAKKIDKEVSPSPKETPALDQLLILKNKSSQIDAKVKLSTNKQSLEKIREEFIKSHGANTVATIENNIKNVFALANTQIYVCRRRTTSLERILDDGLQNFAQTGDIHSSSTGSRINIENKILGIPTKAKPEDRPTYGYFGDTTEDTTTGLTHQTAQKGYGQIVLKLKPEVKNVSTFTGKDSFCVSGPSSEIISKNPPPPPNVASLIQQNYQEKMLVAEAQKIKTLPDLILVGDGMPITHKDSIKSTFVEAQMYGGVRPNQIEEIHFNGDTASNTPSLKVLEWAKKNKVKVFRKKKQQEIDQYIAQFTK